MLVANPCPVVLPYRIKLHRKELNSYHFQGLQEPRRKVKEQGTAFDFGCTSTFDLPRCYFVLQHLCITLQTVLVLLY